MDRWAVAEDLPRRLAARVREHVADWHERHPLSAGLPAESLRSALDVPDPLLDAAVAAAGLRVRDGVVLDPARTPSLPESVESAVRVLERRFARDPFVAPEAHDLAKAGLGPKHLAAAERAGRLLRIADGVVLGPTVLDEAVRVLSGLPEPFTVSEARRALGTTRRVAVPLLERLDAVGRTRRAADGTRTLHRPHT